MCLFWEVIDTLIDLYYRIRWNVGGSIIWRNAIEKHFDKNNIGDLDEML